MGNNIRRIGLVGGGASWLLLLAYTCLVPLALAWGAFSSLPILLIAAIAYAVAIVVIPRLLSAIVLPLDFRIGVRSALILIILIGVSLRVAWVAIVTPVQLSDAQTYVDSARELLLGNGYYQMLFGHKLLAYRAPGESFVLAGAIAMLGDHLWTPAAVNVVVYVLSSVLLFALVSCLSTPKRAIAAVAFLAMWPSGIMITGLAVTEMISLALWLALAYCVVQSGLTARTWPWAVGGGLALGVGILVRPSKLLAMVLPALTAPLEVRPASTLLRTAVIGLLAALIVAPWTYRNYVELHAFVPVSTNGGDNFYRVNNPLASGGFTDKGEQSFTQLLPDEVAWDKASMQAGKKWVLENPLGFAKLVVHKVLIALSADDTGAYWSLLRGHGIDGSTYTLATMASNFWWIILWAFVGTSLVTNRRFFIETAAGLTLTSFSSYFLLIHSVYESQPRYHMPAVGVLVAVAIMSSAAMRRSATGDAAGIHDMTTALP